MTQDVPLGHVMYNSHDFYLPAIILINERNMFDRVYFRFNSSGGRHE